MNHCRACKRDVIPSVSLDAQRGAVRVCPECAAPLEDEPSAPSPVVRVDMPVIARSSARPQTTTDLPTMIRDRKRELRARIKRDQRELAQLERLTRPSPRRAPVSPIRKVAT